MKRNWDTVRELLTKVECLKSGNTIKLSTFPTERSLEVSYHMELLIEAGLVVGRVSKTLGAGPRDFLAYRLTWNGHEFLDKIQNESIWQKTKKVFVSKGIDMTFDLIKSVATDVARSVLKEAIGG